MVVDPWKDRMGIGSRVQNYHRLRHVLGPRYATCTLDNFEIYDTKSNQAKVLGKIREFSKAIPERLRTGGGVILYGRPGTGKDHLLVALMYEAVLRHGWSAWWTHGPTMMAAARDSMFRENRPESEWKVASTYTEPMILTISDPLPPKGDASQHSTDLLQRIVEYRYRHLKSTWVSMNVRDGAEAERRLASALVDRLRHNSLALECNWESYRARDPNRRLLAGKEE